MSTTIVEMTSQERLTERLSDPHTAEALNRLLDRLDVIAFTFEALDGFLQRGPAVADSIGETLREIRHAADGEGHATGFLESVPKLVRAGAQLAQTTDKPEFQNLLASGLIEKLGNPRTIESLKALLDRLELAAFLLEAVDGFLRRGDEVAESVASGVAEWRETAPGMDIDRLKALGDALPKLLDATVLLVKSGALERFPRVVDTAIALADKGLFEMKTVGVLADIGQRAAASYEEVKTQPRQPVGLLGLLRGLNDPDVQKSVALLLAVAKRYGQTLA